ncbi:MULTISPECIES: hemerythrin domain-containing protein [unclassified Knoellia]|uniref:hemerythrin domain-containing protein n=1 Tax=Knoellia altitudinis TaxID=3404795 RepID=UPI00360D0732
MTTTDQPRLTDTSVMVLLHTLPRREFRLAPGVVRRVADGERHRVAEVDQHLTLLTTFLHHHHGVEDDVLWPLLLDRVSDELAPVITLMESQHERLDALLGELGPAQASWRESASAKDRERLATILDELYVHLIEHLDAEEQRLLPIAARTVSQAEWDDMGHEAQRRAPRRGRTLVLGMFAHDGDPAVLRTMLRDAPPPVRAVLLRSARRAFRRHSRRIHGTETP